VAERIVPYQAEYWVKDNMWRGKFNPVVSNRGQQQSDVRSPHLALNILHSAIISCSFKMGKSNQNKGRIPEIDRRSLRFVTLNF
jgi:hypothetical protein